MQDLEELPVECVECGALVDPARDPVFVLEGDEVLCFECAVRRGGVYEADEDRWVVVPAVTDLPDERRSHA